MEKRLNKISSAFTLFVFTLATFVSLASATYVETDIIELMRKTMKRDDDNPQNDNVCTTSGCLATANKILESMDPTVDPCEDFYNFACGNWIRTHSIPDDKAKVDMFSITTDKLMMDLKTEVEKPSSDNEIRAIRATKDIYAACTNEAIADYYGLAIIREWIKEFGGWPMAQEAWNPSTFNWPSMDAALARESFPLVVSVNVGKDVKNTTRNLLYISQGQAILPARYLLNPQTQKNTINAYKNLVINVATIVGEGITISDEDIDKLLQFETALANISNEALRSFNGDYNTIYNIMTISEVYELTGNRFDWLSYLNQVFKDIQTITEEDTALVSFPNVLKQFFDILDQVDNRTLANFMMWKYVQKYSWHINNETRAASFEFDRLISGVTIPPARWFSCVTIVNDLLSLAIGSIYVRSFLPNDTKPEATVMIGKLRTTFNEILDKNTWMDSPTLEKAKVKSTSMFELIAYPDELFDDEFLDEEYKELTASLADIINYQKMLQLAGKNKLSKLNEPVDRSTWPTPVSTVNAFYQASANIIVFPAGILQQPFFSPTNIKAMNYGGIGTIIGHEISHGFDNEGHKNDEFGNVVNWWTNKSTQAYSAKAQCIRDQYGKYCDEELQQQLNLKQIPCTNPNLTLDENIADNGGMKIAYQSYISWMQNHGERLRLPGLLQYSDEQLFFISFAQLWCTNMRPRTTYTNLYTDAHTAANFRVQGVLSNSHEFARAFQCPPNSTMNPPTKCEFW